MLGLLGDLGSNSVHVFGTLLGESLANDLSGTIIVFNGHLSDESGLLELLEAVSDVLSGSHTGVLSAGSVSHLGGVVLSEGVDTDSSSHVELIGDRGSSSVKPVIIIWGQIVGTGSLVVICPLKILILN